MTRLRGCATAVLLLGAVAAAEAMEPVHEHEHEHHHAPAPAPAPPPSGHEHHHDHGAEPAPVAPPAAAAVPPLTDADREAAKLPRMAHPAHDNDPQWWVLLDRFERSAAGGPDVTSWEVQGWYGTDLNRLWLRSEGDQGEEGDAADVELFYGRSVSRWWDVVAGLRHDFDPARPQDFVGVGLLGLAPFSFEVEATAYLGEGGQTAARLELEYDALLTNRLVLQPVLELDAYGRDDPARGRGAGLATLEAGLRLRYEFSRRFAPYVGVQYERAYGRTAEFRRSAGEDVSGTRWMAGLRTWF